MLLCFKESVWIANEFLKKLTLKDSKVSPSEIGSKVFYCIFGGQNWLNEIIPFFPNTYWHIYGRIIYDSHSE